jgi:hypothetical protein
MNPAHDLTRLPGNAQNSWSQAGGRRMGPTGAGVKNELIPPTLFLSAQTVLPLLEKMLIPETTPGVVLRDDNRDIDQPDGPQ